MPKPERPRAPITYRRAGVDIDASSALVTAIKPLAKMTSRPGAVSDLGGFGALFDLKRTSFKDPLLVAATDGVGTKLKIAIETGRHDRIGIDLVAMSVNDLLAQGAEPLFFLDYFACRALDAAVAEAVITGIAMGCREAGCALIGGETAEMPGLYAGKDYDLAGFAVGAVERGEVLPRPDIAAGDVLIGLASSGVHSNAFSLVRKLVADARLSWADPAPFEPERTLGEALLEPTRIYVRPVLPLMRDPGGIKAISHITGGGLSENVPRVIPAGLAATIDLSCWSAQQVFGWLKRAGRLTTLELLRTFNCGIGLVIVAAPKKVRQLCTLLDARGEVAIPIGRIVEGGGPGAKKVQAKGSVEAEAVRYTGKLRFD